MKNKFNSRDNKFLKIRRTIHCSCGNEVIEKTRKNYPFGRNSKCQKVSFYLCHNCGKRE